jgi:hypothetical protein
MFSCPGIRRNFEIKRVSQAIHHTEQRADKHGISDGPCADPCRLKSGHLRCADRLGKQGQLFKHAQSELQALANGCRVPVSQDRVDDGFVDTVHRDRGVSRLSIFALIELGNKRRKQFKLALGPFC